MFQDRGTMLYDPENNLIVHDQTSIDSFTSLRYGEYRFNNIRFIARGNRVKDLIRKKYYTFLTHELCI